MPRDYTYVNREGRELVYKGVGSEEFRAESQRFLRAGVFYVANPNSIASRVEQGRATFASSETVDAVFANGGLTSSGGHPIQIFEREPITGREPVVRKRYNLEFGYGSRRGLGGPGLLIGIFSIGLNWEF